MGTRWWIATSILFLAALTQASFFPATGLVRVRPDLVLLCVVVWAVLRGVREALPWAFVGGLLLDLFSGGPFGVSSLALVLVAFFSSVGEVSIFRSHYILPVLTAFWGSILYGVLFLFLMTTMHHPVDWLPALRYVVVPSAVLNTLCAPVVYYLLSQVERRSRRSVVIAW